MSLVLLTPGSAWSDVDVEPGDNPGLPSTVITGEDEVAVDVVGNILTDAEVGGDGASFEYHWLPACFANHPGVDEVTCANAYNCADPRAMQWTLWARPVTDKEGTPVQGAGWQIVLTQCRLTEPAEIATPRPQVTDAHVLSEVKRLGLPRLAVEVQPADATLVNFETIFYTEPQPWDRTVTLLDYTVDVHAEPTTYVWRFGDGGWLESQSPGAPYPDKDVTHLYSDAGVVVSPQVDTAYEIRYRVEGGPWQTISETVAAAGLPVDLRIREATAVLVGD